MNNIYYKDSDPFIYIMDSIRKDIQIELQRIRIDKKHIYATLLRIMDVVSPEVAEIPVVPASIESIVVTEVPVVEESVEVPVVEVPAAEVPVVEVQVVKDPVVETAEVQVVEDPVVETVEDPVVEDPVIAEVEEPRVPDVAEVSKRTPKKKKNKV